MTDSTLAAHAEELRQRMGTRARSTMEHDLEREKGWLEAIAHLAKQGGLSPACEAEARKMVAASEEWFAGLTTPPGDALRLPVPPALCETLGARSDARYIGFEYTPLGDDILWSDGQNSGSGATWSWLTFKRHPTVAPHLEPYDLGSSDAPAAHMLLIDRETNTASVAPVAEARAFLADQHPPLDLTPEQVGAVRTEFDRLLAERPQPIGPEACSGQMREQSSRMAAMKAFLDQQVPPGQGPTPP